MDGQTAVGWVRPHFASLGAGYADDLSCRLNAIDLSFSTISLISRYRSFHVHDFLCRDCAYRLWMDGLAVASLTRCCKSSISRLEGQYGSTLWVLTLTAFCAASTRAWYSSHAMTLPRLDRLVVSGSIMRCGSGIGLSFCIQLRHAGHHCMVVMSKLGKVICPVQIWWIEVPESYTEVLCNEIGIRSVSGWKRKNTTFA